MNNFTPPYLRFDVPAEKIKIAAIMRAFWIRHASLSSVQVISGINNNLVNAETLGSSSTATPSTAASASGGKRPIKAGPVAAKRSANVKAQATVTTSAQLQDFGDIAIGKTSGQKVAGAITVTPSGIVKLGHNCKMTFSASGPVGSSIWVIYTSNQNQTVYSPFALLGVINNSSNSTTITFKLDYSVYSLFPGKPFFIVAKDSSGNTIQSDLVTLDPTGVASCNQIDSVRFYSLATGAELGTGCTLKGGDHDSEPRFRINLQVPAHAGGQIIRIKSSSVSRVWLWGDNATHLSQKDFVVPAGQQYFDDYGIIGTANVSLNQSHQLFSCIIQPDWTEGDLAYANVNLLA